MSIVFRAEIKDGVMELSSRKYFRQAVKKQKDGKYRITLEQEKAKRSVSQNNYYWAAAIQPIAEFTGYSPNEIHEYCKKNFLQAKKIKINKSYGEIPPSTTSLNTLEFMEYLDSIIKLAAEMGIVIPTSEEYYNN